MDAGHVAENPLPVHIRYRYLIHLSVTPALVAPVEILYLFQYTRKELLQL